MTTVNCGQQHGGGGHGQRYGGGHHGGGWNGGGGYDNYNRLWSRSYYPGDYSLNFFSPYFAYQPVNWGTCNTGNHNVPVSFSNKECDWPIDAYTGQSLYQQLNAQLNCCDGFVPQSTSACVNGVQKYTCKDESNIIY